MIIIKLKLDLVWNTQKKVFFSLPNLNFIVARLIEKFDSQEKERDLIHFIDGNFTRRRRDFEHSNSRHQLAFWPKKCLLPSYASVYQTITRTASVNDFFL